MASSQSQKKSNFVIGSPLKKIFSKNKKNSLKIIKERQYFVIKNILSIWYSTGYLNKYPTRYLIVDMVGFTFHFKAFLGHPGTM